MGKIYTKNGDEGITTMCGESYRKSAQIAKALGAVDELNGHIGLLHSKTNIDFLIEIQKHLLYIGSEIGSSGKEGEKFQQFTLTLENVIDNIQEKLPELNNFILPSGCEEACQAHIARSVCRRAESEVEGYQGLETVNILPYLNRLSDFLFVLARAINKSKNIKDTIWNKNS